MIPVLRLGGRTDLAGLERECRRPELGNPRAFPAGSEQPLTPFGARLFGEGSMSISANNLKLTAVGLDPGKPGLYFQGNNRVAGGSGVHFGDGLRCAGGGVIRLQVRMASDTGESQTTASISTIGGVQPGDVKRYQIWYRDPNTSPCGGLFNLSNGMEVTWSA